jgi:uncharacterized protein (UPF0305 family)
MAKLKSFEQFLSEMDRTEEIQQDVVELGTPDEKGAEEAQADAETVQSDSDEVKELTEETETEEVNEGLHPKLKKAQKAIKNGETVYGENVRFPGRFKIIELGDMFAKVDYEDGTEPMEMASMNIRIDSLQFESVETEIEEGNAFGDAVRKAKEAGEKEFEFEGETYKVEESEEATEEEATEEEATKEEVVEESEEVEEEATEEEAVEESEDVEEDRAEEIEDAEKKLGTPKSVSDMLMEVYESCKDEAKAYEEDAHDEHTVESYMKENAALIAGLAAKSLKEMKEEYAVEAYEAACNSMIESYTNKMNEMKESDSAHDAEEA